MSIKNIINIEFLIQIIAYFIPISFLFYVLYINFLPFGYDKTFIINVGSENDNNISQDFFLKPSKDISERKVDENGMAYRELGGIVYAVFKPKVVLKDVPVTVSVEGDDVYIIPPVIDFDPSYFNWDFFWDFTKNKTPKELGFVGNAFPFDGAMYFDGDSKIELPNTKNQFEDESFSVYLEYMPTEQKSETQQIIGHFNWEIWQNKDSVEFRVGRMNDKDGQAYSIKYPIDENFFNKKHTLLAIYNSSEKGYMDLYIDNNFSGRKYFNLERIWKDYGNKNLSIGKSDHGDTTYMSGYIYDVGFMKKNILSVGENKYYNTNISDSISIPLFSNTVSKLQKISIYVKK